MIPSLTVRADNAFALPLLEAYANACREWAAEYPSSQLLQRADDADALAVQFQDWQNRHPERVKMERTLALTDTGEKLREARRQLREVREALARVQALLATELAAERRERAALEMQLRQAQARAKQAAPDQHVGMEPTTR